MGGPSTPQNKASNMNEFSTQKPPHQMTIQKFNVVSQTPVQSGGNT